MQRGLLAYVLEMAIRQALGKARVLSEKDYHAVMEDLRRLGVGEVVSSRRRYMMRAPLVGRAHEAFAAVGMRVPPRVLTTLAADADAATAASERGCAGGAGF